MLPLTGDLAESCQRLFYDNTIASVSAIEKDCSYIRIVAYMLDFFIFFELMKKADAQTSAFLVRSALYKVVYSASNTRHFESGESLMITLSESRT